MSLSVESLMCDSVLEAPRPTVATQLFSFVFVGGLGALCYVGLSMLLIDLRTGMPEWLVGALAYALLILPVYMAHRHCSFRSDVPHTVALPRYVAVQVTAIVLASVFSYVSYNLLGLASGYAALLVIGLTSGVNFVILKIWAFARA
jgi:putative flippase GtrA